MKLLVCGSREFSSRAFVWAHLDRVHETRPIAALMQGGHKSPRSVDRMAKEWACTKIGIVRYQCDADWDLHGRVAGPIRNSKMLLWEPDLVMGFAGGHGTEDMIRKARAKGYEVFEVSEESSRWVPREMAR